MDSRKSSKSDKYLIAEQPGMAILISGLILAFFIGHTTKSLLSPSRVSAHIEKAASHIHKDVQVSFESAKVSFSDGILPRFAVIITGVQMQSNKTCWGAPLLSVDELRLPISMTSLIRGRAPIRSVEANNVHLLLREDVTSCETPEESLAATSPAPMPSVRLSPSESSQKYRNDIRSVTIQSFHIASDKHPQYATELVNFNTRVRSFEPRVIEIRAKSNLFKDSRVGDYLSHANLYIQYKESPEKTVQTHFFGNWREGHYSLIANYNFDEEQVAIETDLKHIPLSQVLRVMQKYGMASDNLNGRQVWLSSKARMLSTVQNIKTAPIEVRDMRMEGDLGEIHLEKIDITSVNPFTYKPIRVDVRKLDVEKLLVLLNRPKQTGILGNLGTFTGRADIYSDEKMRLTGEHSGLEFVFSNKGQQEVQVLNNIVGDVTLEKDHWSFDIKRIEPKDGLFAGDLSVRADRDFKNVDIKTHIDEMSFAPAVQRLMTGNGSVGVMNMDSQLRLTDTQLSFLKGQMNVSDMQIEGMSFGKTKFQFDWVKDQFVLKTQMNSLSVAETSPASSVLKPLTPQSFWNQNALSMQNVSGKFQGKDLRNIAWQGFQAQFGKQGSLKTEGRWNESSELKGQVEVLEGKKLRQWGIEGTREMPLFIEETGKSLRR